MLHNMQTLLRHPGVAGLAALALALQGPGGQANANAVSPGMLRDKAHCCETRSHIVPAVAVGFDIGLPAAVLLVSAVVLAVSRRRRRQPVKHEAAILDGAAMPASLSAGSGELALEIGRLSDAPAAGKALPSAHQPACGLQALAMSLWRSYGWWHRREGIGSQQAPAGKKRRRFSQQAADRDTALRNLAADTLQGVFHSLCSTPTGLTSAQAATRLASLGPNRLDRSQAPGPQTLLFAAVVQPFNLLMLAVAVLTICPPNSDWKTFIVVMVLLLVAIVLRFVEESRSVALARALEEHELSRTQVHRDGKSQPSPRTGIVPGDVVDLSAGDTVPGDVRLLSTCALFIGAAMLTGEAMPVRKHAAACCTGDSLVHLDNICLAGSHIVSGSGTAVVLATGVGTHIAGTAAALLARIPATASERAVKRIALLYICFIVTTVPLVIGLNGWTSKDWHGAVTFGLAVAVALTPQMLPMVLTTCLARGAAQLRSRHAVIRRLDAVHNLGAMDVLCMDKTGTLTEDNVKLLRHVNAHMQPDAEVLELAYMTSGMQSCPRTPLTQLDQSILDQAVELRVCSVVDRRWLKLAEVPFDHERRRRSVIVQDLDARPQLQLVLVCQGASEEVLTGCTHVAEDGQIVPLTAAARLQLAEHAQAMGLDGLRVLAIATKAVVPCDGHAYSVKDEVGLVFRGFLAFLDPPKKDAAKLVEALEGQHVRMMVVTGDALPVTRHVCRHLNIAAEHYLEGPQLAGVSDSELAQLVQRCTVVAKADPHQKQRIVRALQASGRTVGFLGNGTNDALALRQADVGVTVALATGVAKEASDVALQQDRDQQDRLAALPAGIVIGREVHGNIIKYIKISSSSSFGNCVSIMAAAAWLPFTPITPLQVLLLNLLYNTSQMALPWDNVDPGFLRMPQKWSARHIGLYMLVLGPLSSVFDVLMFVILWHRFGLDGSTLHEQRLFQTAWFLESLITQTFIVHMLRTERLPFVQSMARWPLLLSTALATAVGVALSYIPEIEEAFALTPIQPLVYAFMAGLLAGYCMLAQLAKMAYRAVFDCWL